ncbi:MAG: S-methyl-5-thioribose-1-phosphate isomerase [Clostridia bacterium]|nr:S-methyl-5-thioribose-1-phosphate isomerase [Clostridia bacterium]
MDSVTSLEWQDGVLVLLDQTLLPGQITYRVLGTVEQVRDAIRDMVVRGAPAIGVAAAYGMALAARQAPSDGFPAFYAALDSAGHMLALSRPTAVNLSWAIDRMLAKSRACSELPVDFILTELEQEAIAIHQEDIAINRAIGSNLLSLVQPGDTILTHCNAGALATAGYGTALSVFFVALEQGIELKAFIDETRPRLQGARLTAFELVQSGIDATLVSDNMAAVVMSQAKIQAVIVGCDRIAANGDTANKIGTFGLSILARHFNIPFYIAAPTPTIDWDCPSGHDIPIEERSGEEITMINGERIAPAGVKTYNPSFDVTPAAHISAIVTERGIVRPPFAENLAKIREPWSGPKKN